MKNRKPEKGEESRVPDRVHARRRQRGPWLGAALALSISILLPFLWAQEAPQILEEGRAAFYAGELARARPLLEGYLRIIPGDQGARILLARTLSGLGEGESALRLLRQALEMEPENVDALYYLGALNAALSQAEFERLNRMAPGSARVHQLMGESFFARRNFAEAERAFRAAIAADPSLLEVAVSLGDLKRTQGSFEEAVDFYHRVISRNPSDYGAHYGLGVSFRYLQRPEDAVRHLRKAVELAPESAPAQLALGTTLVQQGRFSEALEPLLSAAELEPGMDQAHFQLGRVYQSLGEREKAREAFETARRLAAEAPLTGP